MIYDLLIIGAGPAGITAAIYAARKSMKTLVIGDTIGGKAAWSSAVQNFTGYQLISGKELTKKFEEHLRGFDVKIVEKINAEYIVFNDGLFKVKAGNEFFDSKTVLIATGRKAKVFRIPGEKEFRNRGVSYCATCDAPLYKGKEVAVLGGGNPALDAAVQLISIAKKIYLVCDELAGDQPLINTIKSSEKVVLFEKARIDEIKGAKNVEAIVIESANGEKKELQVQGLFIETGTDSSLIPIIGSKSSLMINENDEIAVNDKCETNLKGLYAAGDVTTVPEKQIIVAAGQGAIAALSAFKYLTRQENTTWSH